MRITLTICVVCLGAYIGYTGFNSIKGTVEARNAQLCSHHPDFC